MCGLSPSSIAALRSRDVELAAPLSPSAWAQSSLPSEAVRSLKRIYEVFDGFVIPDYKSQTRLWSFSEVLSFNRKDGAIDLAGQLYIGDFLIESDYIRLDLASGAVGFEGDADRRFSSVADFIDHLVDGRLDFM